MSDKTEKSSIASGNSTFSIAVIAFIYATITEISSGVTFATGSNTEAQINFAIFVPASAAILFGKGIGGASAGIGTLLQELQGAALGGPSLSIETLIASLANGAGAYTVGFLTQIKDWNNERHFIKIR